MQLDQLKLGLRRRNPWEALDLGLVMLRQWKGPVYRAWSATFILFSLLVIALLWQWPLWATFVIWWLKPLFDRVLLKVFAEASFGAAPNVRDVWRALPGLIRHTGLFSGLTLRRFNPGRSFELPVWQLEGQRGKTGRLRLRVLSRKAGGHAFWLLLVCTHIVVIFEFGLVSLIDFLTPSDGMPFVSWTDLFTGGSSDHLAQIFNFAWLIAESIVEPYYVAAGFSLYLNRRSELEGWDIEVAFRRMSERLRRSASASASGLARMVVIAVMLAGLSGPWITREAHAAQSTCPAPTTPTSQPAQTKPHSDSSIVRPDGRIKKLADEVLVDPVFGKKTTELSWRPIKKDETQTETEVPAWAKALIRFADLLATGTRGLIYLAVVLVAAALLVLIYRYRGLIPGFKRRESRVPETLFGLDLRPASLPDDIAAAALAEVKAGRHAAALSLLYRGTLVALIRYRHIEFRFGDTEGLCLSRVHDRIDPDSEFYFAQLLAAWTRAAYAGMAPDGQLAEDLCRRWAPHFATVERAA